MTDNAMLVLAIGLFVIALAAVVTLTTVPH
jgi:hypothetical protein